MNVDIVILAAGQGTRMRSSMPKVLHKIGGTPMLGHVVNTASQITADSKSNSAVHVVIGHGADQVRDALQGKCSFVVQEEQLGTGHAVSQALPQLGEDSVALILYGDVPLTRVSTLDAMLSGTDANSIAVLTTHLDDPTGYGRIVRNDAGEVTSIVEQKDASDEQKQINEINTGIMAVPSARLRDWLPRLKNSNAQQEYYLTDIIALAAAAGVTINTPHPQDNYEVQGVNDRSQLAELEREYQRQRAHELMLAGATLADPSRVDIRGNVSVGCDVNIDINAVFVGEVELGDNVSIGPNCVLKNCRIGANTEIHENCVVESATTGRQCSIGPFARLRPDAQLHDKVKVGNFVEIKKSQLHEGSKANHLAYIGDADIGAGSNIGAGTITCNYDGANKFRTELGDNVFIGSNSTLVAPLKIESGAFVGAGSTITQAVSKDNLAIARSRQSNIEGWQKPSKDK